jgi:hypothetical protein
MPPKNRDIPASLESIILIAVEFGRDHGCQLYGHLICRINGNEHIPLTNKEIISKLAISSTNDMVRYSFTVSSDVFTIPFLCRLMLERREILRKEL